jgi:Ca-activated chloride channel family protein
VLHLVCNGLLDGRVNELKTRLLALVLVLLAEEISLSNQSMIRETSAPQQGSPSATFKSGVDLVALSVVVRDTHNRFVPGLKATDFVIYEDGVQQDISFFAASEVPLDLAVVIDTSASMADKIATLQEAAVGFASTVRSTDRICVVEIKGAVRTRYTKGPDVASAVAAIRATQPSGTTALFNGLYVVLKGLANERRAFGEVRRQAIVVFSDGEDTTSLVNFDDLMDVARRAGVAIFTITLRTPSSPSPLARDIGTPRRPQVEFAMRSLARETGGRAFFPTAVEELAGIYGNIAAELAHQYSIGYTSKNPSRGGEYRRVTVRLAQRSELQAHARTGYIAARAESVPSIR